MNNIVSVNQNSHLTIKVTGKHSSLQTIESDKSRKIYGKPSVTYLHIPAFILKSIKFLVDMCQSHSLNYIKQQH